MKKLIFLFSFFLSTVVLAQTISGKIISVKDGDTVVLLKDGKQIVIRLEHVDAPEHNQPFGYKAKRFVLNFCYRKTVTVISKGERDRNGRWIAEIFYNNQNLGKELVRNGLAWHFKRFSKNNNYAQLEIEARKKKIGLWQEQNPVAPWNWRDFRKQKTVYQK